MQRSRSANSFNKGDNSRIWDDHMLLNLMNSLKGAFPNTYIIPFSDKNTTLMNCVACQIELLSKASVLIGVHGAGMGNMLYMPSHAVCVELTVHDGKNYLLFINSS